MSSYITPGKRKRVYERDGYMCRYCGKTEFREGEISIDHIIPKSKGGTSNMDNLVTACYHCNSIIKHNKSIEESGLTLIDI